MASFAKAIVVGYCGRDIELRYLPSGQAVANVSVATTERRKENGEVQETTTWWRCTLWGKQAETANKFLAKGSQVYFEGRPCLREYTDREGNKRSSLELTVSDMQFLGSKSDSGAEVSRAEAAGALKGSKASGAKWEAAGPDEGDGDIPF